MNEIELDLKRKKCKHAIKIETTIVEKSTPIGWNKKWTNKLKNGRKKLSGAPLDEKKRSGGMKIIVCVLKKLWKKIAVSVFLVIGVARDLDAKISYCGVRLLYRINHVWDLS